MKIEKNIPSLDLEDQFLVLFVYYFDKAQTVWHSEYHFKVFNLLKVNEVRILKLHFGQPH